MLKSATELTVLARVKIRTSSGYVPGYGVSEFNFPVFEWGLSRSLLILMGIRIVFEQSKQEPRRRSQLPVWVKCNAIVNVYMHV